MAEVEAPDALVCPAQPLARRRCLALAAMPPSAHAVIAEDAPVMTSAAEHERARALGGGGVGHQLGIDLDSRSKSDDGSASQAAKLRVHLQLLAGRNLAFVVIFNGVGGGEARFVVGHVCRLGLQKPI